VYARGSVGGVRELWNTSREAYGKGDIENKWRKDDLDYKESMRLTVSIQSSLPPHRLPRRTKRPARGKRDECVQRSQRGDCAVGGNAGGGGDGESDQCLDGGLDDAVFLGDVGGHWYQGCVGGGEAREHAAAGVDAGEG